MNALTPIPPGGGNSLNPRSMQEAMQLATMMARAKLVPTHLQGKEGDCLLIIEQALRWSMSPFAVAQSTSVIQGKLMFEGKLVSAAVQSSGLLSSRLAYEFDGEGATRAVTVSATMRGEDKPRTIRCTLAEAKTTNGMWTKQPDQQLIYFATRAWARRHAPEVMLGVYSPEEFDAPQQRQDNFVGQTINAEPLTTGQMIGDAIPERVMEPAQPKRTAREIIRDKLVGCTTEAEVFAIAELPLTKKALAEAPEAIREEIGDLLATALDRVRENDMAGADDPVEGAP